MKKLNKAAMAAIISASVIAAPFIGYFTFKAGQNLNVRLYFKELYPNAEVTRIREIEHKGWFGGVDYTKKITLYDKEHGFYFDQTFYYEGLKALPLDDANAIWRDRYLKTAIFCENIVNAIPECYDGEYFTRYSVGSGVCTDGMFIFLKQPSAEEFEKLVEKITVVSSKNYTGDEYRRSYEGYIQSTVIVLSPELYDKMQNVDFSQVYECKNTTNWRKGDYEEYIGRMFKKSISANVFPMYTKDGSTPLSEFYDGSLDENSFICAEIYPLLNTYNSVDNSFYYFELL